MATLEELEQEAAAGHCSLERFCKGVAQLLQVRAHEVAILSLRHSMLQFVYPLELRKTGMIPLISSAQAAKTASSKQAEIFNHFTSVRHNSIFETIKIGDEDPLTIQKLMSAPILNPGGETVGVMQVCRKGASLEEAGADFGPVDLLLLQSVARVFGRISGNLQERA